MTSDFDDILNMTKRDFQSKPVTTVYFRKDDKFVDKVQSDDPNFVDKVSAILERGDTNGIMLVGEANNIERIKSTLKEFIDIKEEDKV